MYPYSIVTLYLIHLLADMWSLYEIYKVGNDDEHIVILPFGNWELPDGELEYVKSEKYLRRRNLMVMCFPVADYDSL